VTTAVRTEYDSLSFGGAWLPTASAERVEVVSPHNAKVIGSTPYATEADVDHAVALACQAFDRSPRPHLAPQVHDADVARRLRTGMVGINGFAPDLWSPFGAYKQSGIGREDGPVGLEGDLEYKSIYGAP
jgi:acyl-CoA reductase-like NAD-dependent aldehyde dehydrogenase